MRDVRLGLGPAGVEGMPLDEIAHLEEQRLVEGRVVERALVSSLYRIAWREQRIDPDKIRKRSDLRRLPFTSAADIQEAQKRKPIRQFPCAEARVWFGSSTTGEGRKWIPYGRGDLLGYMGLLVRVGRVLGLEKGDLFLSVAPPPPRVTNALIYLLMYTDILDTHLQWEFIVGSMMTLESSDWLQFAQCKQPTVLMGRPSDLLACAEHLTKADGQPAGITPNGFQQLRTGIFFGEPLAPSRQKIEAVYGLEAHDCYLTAEFAGVAIECSAHQGLHVWQDVCIPEIIPKEETKRMQANSRYMPETVFLDEAGPGLEGEYVLTTFGEALPLIRYRTGDLVQVVDTQRCACGVTHPRINVLGRL